MLRFLKALPRTSFQKHDRARTGDKVIDYMVVSSVSDHKKSGGIRRVYRPALLDAICVTVLVAYSLHFALAALRGGFS